MKATEFLKKVGICEAKAVLLKSEYHFEVDVYLPDMKEFTYIAINPTDSCPYVGLSDLKQIVEAFDSVEACGGVDKVKKHLKQGNVFRFEEKPLMRQAINLVEQCQK